MDSLFDFFFNGTAPTCIYTYRHPLSLHDALPSSQGHRVEPEAHPERGGYYRSDHFSFAKLGVPMLDAGSGEDLVSGGTAAGEAAAKEDRTSTRLNSSH